MNYYYDLLLNFQDKYWMFYEWEEDDNIEFIRKIPMFHITNKEFKDILNNTIKVDEDFLKQIKNTTKLKDNKFLLYACLFSDGKNAIALEFNEEGVGISKSSLILDDELSVNEFMFNIENCSLNYEIVEKNEKYHLLRQEEKIQKLLLIEIKNIYKEKNYSKLKFLYLEWFDNLLDNIDNMYNEMIDEIKTGLSEKSYKIYELIKSTYNNV